MARPLAIPEIGDVSPKAIAQRMGLTEERFHELFDALSKRGFPRADPDTGNFCIEAVDRWRRLRHANLLIESASAASLTAQSGALDAAQVHAHRRARGG